MDPENESEDEDDSFLSPGYYTPVEAAKLFAAFEAADVDERAKFTDATDRMNAAHAAEGGSFGWASQVWILFDPSRRERVEEIHVK